MRVLGPAGGPIKPYTCCLHPGGPWALLAPFLGPFFGGPLGLFWWVMGGKKGARGEGVELFSVEVWGGGGGGFRIVGGRWFRGREVCR